MPLRSLNVQYGSSFDTAVLFEGLDRPLVEVKGSFKCGQYAFEQKPALCSPDL